MDNGMFQGCVLTVLPLVMRIEEVADMRMIEKKTARRRKIVSESMKQ